jgi:glycosyltransferase involved in cell wall biosynthesis
MVIDAIHLLPSHENILVTIIGEGPERQNLKSLIRKYNLESTINLRGKIEYSAMPEIMAASDIFILSSRSEGRPNVVAEAVASGLPIVSAGLPGVQGLVVEGINGWLFKTGDSLELSKAIQHAILNKESLCAMGESGREMIRNESNWSVAADYYGSLFNKLIDENIR